MAKYRLSKKHNRLNSGKDGRWYATPAPAPRLDTRNLCRFASENTTLSAFEVRAVLDLINQYVPQMLAQGYTVQLGDLGSLRLAFGSEGVEQPEDFHPRLMRPARIVFQPARSLNHTVRRLLTFEAAGVVDDGLAFGDIASWRRHREEQGR